MKTVFEEAIETGEKTFPHIWQTIRQGVAAGMTAEAIAAALRRSLKRRPSRQFWQWVEDATTAAKHRSELEAIERRRRFRLVKGDNHDRQN